MTRVLIADDQILVSAGFRAILEAQPDLEVVAEGADGAEAVELARRLRPDVALMDIRMPGVDGIEAIRRIGLAGLPTRVLILTTFDLDEYVYDALRAGASGFLVKDVPRDQLVLAVRTVAGGGSLLAPAGDPPDDRALRAAAAAGLEAARGAVRPRRARARRHARARSRAHEPGDRGGARPERDDGQDARREHPHEARPA